MSPCAEAEYDWAGADTGAGGGGAAAAAAAAPEETVDEEYERMMAELG